MTKQPMITRRIEWCGTLLVEMSVRALKVVKKDKIQEVREYDHTMGECHT